MSPLLTLMILAGSANSAGTSRPAWLSDPAPGLIGPLSADAISDGLLRAESQVNACYAALAAQRPAPAAVGVARFTVQPDGRAPELTVSTERGTESWFGGCLAAALRQASFATADTSTVVTWTMRFGEGSPGGTNVAPPGTDGGGVTLGSLDKGLIDAEIKRNMSEIRLCYQRELTAAPKLAGKIVIRFVIATDGSVSAAETRSTTMNNSAVEHCIVDEFRTMQFPAPTGNGFVIVSYPFIFAPG